jgi:putative transposase
MARPLQHHPPALFAGLPATGTAGMGGIKFGALGFGMKKKRFSVEQMVGVLKQAEVGVPVAEVIRKAGISEQTFYRWKANYAGLEVDQVRQMAQLQEENLRLKKLVAELVLDKTMLQDVLSKKW